MSRLPNHGLRGVVERRSRAGARSTQYVQRACGPGYSTRRLCSAAVPMATRNTDRTPKTGHPTAPQGRTLRRHRCTTRNGSGVFRPRLLVRRYRRAPGRRRRPLSDVHDVRRGHRLRRQGSEPAHDPGYSTGRGTGPEAAGGTADPVSIRAGRALGWIVRVGAGTPEGQATGASRAVRGRGTRGRRRWAPSRCRSPG